MDQNEIENRARLDAIDAVNQLVQEEGKAVLSSQGSWDDAAINAGAFEISCPEARGVKDLRSAYYAAYERAAQEHVKALLA